MCPCVLSLSSLLTLQRKFYYFHFTEKETEVRFVNILKASSKHRSSARYWVQYVYLAASIFGVYAPLCLDSYETMDHWGPPRPLCPWSRKSTE